MTEPAGSARGTTNQWFIFTHYMLLHTQQAPLKEGLHIKYNTDNMTHKKW